MKFKNNLISFIFCTSLAGTTLTKMKTQLKNAVNENYVRRLGNSELQFDILSKHGSDIIYTMHFDSNFDLFKNKHILIKAIHNWLLIHPLLKSKTVVSDNLQNGKLVSFNRYLVVNDDVNHISKNINILKCEMNNSSFNHKKIYESLRADEMNKELESGQQWRVSLVKIKDNNYSLLFRISHAITDGRNIEAISLQLLEIIEQCYFNTPVLYKSDRILPSLEEIFYGTNEIEQEVKSIFDQTELKAINANLQVPKIFLQKVNENDKTIDQQIDGNILYMNGKLFKKFTKLQILPTNKLKEIIIDADSTKTLYQQCNFHNVKLTGFLSTLLGYALYQTFYQYGVEKFLNDGIHYRLPMSLKPFTLPTIDVYNMGFFVSSVYKVQSVFKAMKNKCEQKNYFWKRVKEENDSIHDLLKSQKLFCYPKLRKNFLDSQLNGNKPYLDHKNITLKHHFALSNSGHISLNSNSYKLLDKTLCPSNGRKGNYGTFLFALVNSFEKRIKINLVNESNIYNNIFINSFVRNTKCFLRLLK